MFDEFKIWVAGEMGDVIHATGEQIIKDDDAMAFGKQPVTEMRTEKASTAGDDGG